MPQGSVSRLANSDDMLLSTLAAYLQAIGATDVPITMSVRGRRLELDFDS